MKIFSAILLIALEIIPAGKTFLKPLQQRDSVLIADQIEYGFVLDSLTSGTQIAVPDFKAVSSDTLTLVRGWQLDTLLAGKKSGGKELKRSMGKGHPFGIRASIVLAPFEEGTYRLPDIPVGRMRLGKVDTLIFEGSELDVKTMPVDTSTFVLHDLKGQITYPVTFREVAPWLIGLVLLAGLIYLVVVLIRRAVARAKGEIAAPRDPAYIVALRELDKYRSESFWAPEKQKAFYSGVTDALKFYMEDRFGVDAPEMTTAELFHALKITEDIPKDMYSELKDLFETADFVKFAKHTASAEENSKVLPLSVRFVTSTYQTQLEEERKSDVL